MATRNPELGDRIREARAAKGWKQRELASEVEVEPTDFADAEKVRFRVLTTNGVSYSESTTDDVVLQEEGS